MALRLEKFAMEVPGPVARPRARRSSTALQSQKVFFQAAPLCFVRQGQRLPLEQPSLVFCRGNGTVKPLQRPSSSWKRPCLEHSKVGCERSGLTRGKRKQGGWLIQRSRRAVPHAKSDRGGESASWQAVDQSQLDEAVDDADDRGVIELDLPAKRRVQKWLASVRCTYHRGNVWMRQQVEKFGVIMSSTGAVLLTAGHLFGSGEVPSPLLLGWFVGLSVGSVLGAATVMRSRLKATPRNVVVTGSTRGLGKALAREFLRAGDNVIVASRSPMVVEQTVRELRLELLKRELSSSDNGVQQYDWRRQLRCQMSKSGQGYLETRVAGMACNMQSAGDVERLALFAEQHFGHVDLWINNAGTNPGAKPLLDFTAEELSQVVSTNLLGSLLGSQAAIRMMAKQATGGHVFNMDGAGSGGNPTPRYAAYGATKCALRQLHATLLSETRTSKVGVHTASPGMVLTDLLLSGATLANKQAFNVICEQPETVARALVPGMRMVRGTNGAVNYLTPPRVILAIAMAWFRRGRWFDAEGRAVYAAEAERLRAWGEPKERSPVTRAMDLVPATAWICLYSSSVICCYLILDNVQSTAGNIAGM